MGSDMVISKVGNYMSKDESNVICLVFRRNTRAFGGCGINIFEKERSKNLKVSKKEEIILGLDFWGDLNKKSHPLLKHLKKEV